MVPINHDKRRNTVLDNNEHIILFCSSGKLPIWVFAAYPYHPNFPTILWGPNIVKLGGLARDVGMFGLG